MIRLYPLGPMSNPCVPNSTHATKPFAQLPQPLGVPQKNLSPYSTKPLSVRCSHMPLLDGFRSSATLQPIIWKFYTELHAGSLLVASLPPPPHYSFSRPQLPPLKLILEHQTLYSFERALRLPPDFSSLYALAIKNVPCRLKKKPSWRSSCSSATLPLPSPRESLITRPPFPPWSTTHFTVSPFIPDCTGSRTARLQIASSRLSSLPPSDIQVWTDGSVPSLFGPGGAGVYATCSKCNTSHSLSFSSGPIASSFTAETFALKQGLAWCTSHLMNCKFQSVLFLTDSQSALSILSSAPTYLLPESLWNVWSLASSLSNNTTLSFQWVPGHAGLPGNEKADLLAKTGASLPIDAIPSPLLPVIAKVRYSQYRNWRRHISHSHLNFQVPEVSSEELLLSRSIRCELSRLRCHGHSLLLSSYLHRISRKENSDCSACGHPLQDLNHLLFDCPASEPLRKSIFGSSLSILDLWSRPWGVARLLGLRGVPPRPHLSEGVGLYHHYHQQEQIGTSVTLRVKSLFVFSVQN